MEQAALPATAHGPFIAGRSGPCARYRAGVDRAYRSFVRRYRHGDAATAIPTRGVEATRARELAAYIVLRSQRGTRRLRQRGELASRSSRDRARPCSRGACATGILPGRLLRISRRRCAYIRSWASRTAMGMSRHRPFRRSAPQHFRPQALSAAGARCTRVRSALLMAALLDELPSFTGVADAASAHRARLSYASTGLYLPVALSAAGCEQSLPLWLFGRSRGAVSLLGGDGRALSV